MKKSTNKSTYGLFKDSVAPTEHGTLALLWRNILRDNKVTETQIEQLIKDYDLRDDKEDDASKTKSNIKNSIFAKQMSWKTFTYLLFKILLVRKITLSIKLVNNLGNVSVHTKLIDKSIVEKSSKINPHTVLAEMWKLIIKDNKISLKSMKQLIKNYEVRQEMTAKVFKSRTKSNVMNSMSAKEISWKTFTYLLFNILRIRKITLSVKLIHENDTETVHSILID